MPLSLYDLNVNKANATEATQTLAGLMSMTDKIKLDGIEVGATADMTSTEILTILKTVDGTDSGLDADLLDGQHATYFATSTSLSTEISIRSAQSTTTSTGLSTEVSTRSAAISTEASTRASMDTVISTSLSTEVSTRTVQSTTTSTGLSTEVSTRASMDLAISTALSTEVSIRAASSSTGNILKGNSSFAGSGSTTSITISGPTDTNYVVSITPTAIPTNPGTIGEIYAVKTSTTQVTVTNTGVATTAFSWIVIY